MMRHASAAEADAAWWLVATLALYLVTQGVNTWQEVFGPGSVGILPGEDSFTVVEVMPGLPMDIAGVRTGDTVEMIDGIPVANALTLAEANARQVVTRARQHVADGRKMPANSTDQRRLFEAFIAAAHNGDVASLEVDLIRFGGQLPKGGYDVHNGGKSKPTSPSAIHG